MERKRKIWQLLMIGNAPSAETFVTAAFAGMFLTEFDSKGIFWSLYYTCINIVLSF